MVVHAGNRVDVVSQNIRKHGKWEGFESADQFTGALPQQRGQSPRTAIDIGANIGYYSILFAAAGYNVIAVEPMALNRAALNATLCLNHGLQQRVKLASSALISPKEQEMKCHVRGREPNIGNGVMVCNGLCGSNASENSPKGIGKQKGGARGLCYNVNMQTLDSILSELRPPRIDAVKMDIEGHECSALEGGRSLFEQYRPRFMRFETAWLEGASTNNTCVHRLASQYGYETVTTGGDTILRRPWSWSWSWGWGWGWGSGKRWLG